MTSSLTQIAHDIYQLRLPLPFALNHVNTYLLRDGDSWTIIDTGLNTAEAQTVWHGAFTELNIAPTQIRRILVTHHHPDHFGMAGWLQSLTPAHQPPVYMTPRERELGQQIWYGSMLRHFDTFLLAQGMPDEQVREVDSAMEFTAAHTRPHPPQIEMLDVAQPLHIGARRFMLMLASGHSDAGLMLYDVDDELLFSGDHVLMKITPNIGLWPEIEPDPLGRFLTSLTELRDLKVRLALPGHRNLIENWRGRVDEIIAHHHERLEHTLAAVTPPATPYEASLKVFDSTKFSAHEWRFALAETLAHLEYLRLRGQIERGDDGKYYKT